MLNNSESIGHQVETLCNMSCSPEPREAEIPRSQELQGEIEPPSAPQVYLWDTGFREKLTN